MKLRYKVVFSLISVAFIVSLFAFTMTIDRAANHDKGLVDKVTTSVPKAKKEVVEDRKDVDRVVTKLNKKDESFERSIGKFILLKGKSYTRVTDFMGQELFVLKEGFPSVFHINDQKVYATNFFTNLTSPTIVEQSSTELKKFSVNTHFSEALDVIFFHSQIYFTGYDQNGKLAILSINDNGTHEQIKSIINTNDTDIEMIHFFVRNNTLYIQSNNENVLVQSNGTWTLRKIVDENLPYIQTDSDQKNFLSILPASCKSQVEVKKGNITINNKVYPNMFNREKWYVNNETCNDNKVLLTASNFNQEIKNYYYDGNTLEEFNNEKFDRAIFINNQLLFVNMENSIGLYDLSKRKMINEMSIDFKIKRMYLQEDDLILIDIEDNVYHLSISAFVNQTI